MASRDKDYSKLLVQAGRSQKGCVRSRRSQRRIDGGATRLSMRSSNRSHERYRMLGDYLAPLERYLESRVDRSWAKTYSRIARTSRKRIHREHVMAHVRQIVDLGGQRYRRLYVDGCGVLRRRRQ